MAPALLSELIRENHTGYKVIIVIRIIKIPRIKLNVFDLLLLTFMPKTQSFHQNKPYPSDSLLTIPFASNNNAREKKDFVMLTAAAIPN